jgi:glutamyl/glutaminyl-tRNA synthetase
MTNYDNIIQERLQKLINNLSKDFNLSKLSVSPARFNRKKLDWCGQQYIKSISLEEFIYRSNLLPFRSQYPDRSFISSAYLYVVDFKEQKVLGQLRECEFNEWDGAFYPISTNTTENKSHLEALSDSFKKVILQDTPDVYSAKFLGSRSFVLQESVLVNGQEFDGKSMDFYVLSVDSSKMQEVYNTFEGELTWFELEEVIGNNKYLNYPVWQDFCVANGFECFEPNFAILKQMASWGLDKNRATLLSDLGIESTCVTNYLPCPLESLVWKKSDLENSLNALHEAWEVVSDQDRWQEVIDKVSISIDMELDLEWSDYERLFNVWKENKLEKYLKATSEIWEEIFKNWLTENNKDYGLYLWPLRLSLSGKNQSPSVFEIMAIIGRAETMLRISHYISEE